MIFKSNEDYENQMKKCAAVQGLASTDPYRKVFGIDTSHDPVNHPSHYTSHLAKCECGRGIECIQITEHMPFTVGNAMKYLWRYRGKNGIEDLKKAAWYLQREISRLEKEQA